MPSVDPSSSAAHNQPTKEITVYDDLTGTVKEINQRLAFMQRSANGSHVQFARCRNAANELAKAVYAFVQDPEGVGTDALQAAWETYMQQDSGNFSSEPLRVVGA